MRVIEQGRYETMAMLRNGEQLMLNIIFPVMALIALRFTGLIDEYANSVGVSRMDAAVPGVLPPGSLLPEVLLACCCSSDITS